MKNIYLIVAPSGAGKTLVTELLEQEYGYKSIQSYTTRQPRYEGERGHTFISNEEFNTLVKNETVVAYTEFCGNRYCATAKQVEESDLYVIDPKGIEYFLTKYNGNKGVKVIYINSTTSTRYERMVERGLENGSTRLKASEKALKRIENDVIEFYDYTHNKAKADFVVENNDGDDINTVVDKVVGFITSCEGGD